MNKNTKYALIAVPILIGVYLIYKQLKNGSSNQNAYVPPATPPPVVNPVRTKEQVQAKCAYPLKKGVYNCDLVKKLQWSLNHIPSNQFSNPEVLSKYRPLAEDGDFGPKTDAVLRAWTDLDEVDESWMDVIFKSVVTDPIKFQEEENKYILQQSQPTPPKPNIYV
jgi:hypothetical protein